MAPWGPKNGQNGPFRATGGKNRIDGCDGTEISVVLPLGIIRIDEKTARYGPFFAENQFSPADEFVLVGLVVRKCHFDVTACAEARRLENVIPKKTYRTMQISPRAIAFLGA